MGEIKRIVSRARRRSRRVLRAGRAKIHALTAPAAPPRGKTNRAASTPPSPEAAQPTPEAAAPTREVASPSGVDYEGAWDLYARTWRQRFPNAEFIGDEWQGTQAGAAANIDEYVKVIENVFVTPYIQATDTVLEIGVGGGRTALLLRQHAEQVICADISSDMLDATRARLGDDRIRYVKLDGRTLTGVEPASIDVLFCFDTRRPCGASG